VRAGKAAGGARYPALDPRRIASQSPAILRLLRRRMGFAGVIVTDTLEAQAVRRTSGVAAGAERSLAAGADLVLMGKPRTWDVVYPRVLRRARRSRAFRRRIRGAATRVVELKLRLGLRP
jgi:beta-N-acetylhexosaminidase